MPLLYWALQDIQQTDIAGGFTIVTKSDVACHMWLRHTLTLPQKHAKPVIRRGLQIMYDARFCFVAFEDLEQDEPGDTFTHTFTWTGWEVCQTRYFYFWATSVAEPMKSTSCLFSKHYTYVPTPTTAYFYPDAHPESTSVDGRVRRQCPTYCSWDDIRNGPGVLAYDDVAGAFIQISAHTYANYWFSIDRGIILFDTSSIPPAATILSAQLRLHAAGKGDGLNIHDTFAANVYSSNPASNIALLPADYGATGIIPYSNPIVWDDWSVGIHHTFDFLPAALSAIIKGGITKLALREATYDVTDIAPPWIRNKSTSMAFGTAESGGENRPRLKVIYL